MKKPATTVLLAGAACLMSTLAGADVKRHPLPGSDFPIAQAVEVTPDTTIVYHSGMTPRPANPDAERYSAEFWGRHGSTDPVRVLASRGIPEGEGSVLQQRGEDAGLPGGRAGS